MRVQFPHKENAMPLSNTAVLIPCFNEENTVAEVIAQARRALPQARIVVCDNASTDATAKNALNAGAEVIFETRPGKGNAVRRLFGEVEADYYVLTDGDATYELKDAGNFIQKMAAEKLDFINAARIRPQDNAYRPGHLLGNFVLTRAVGFFFGDRIKDMLSGYKIFSRRFVKTFPARSEGFEIETELTVFALSCRMPMAETAAPYYARPEGSSSKLSTYKDGLKILKTIFLLTKEERPFLFCALAAAALAALSVILAAPILATYLHTGLVPRLPTAVLSTGLMIWALLFFIAGMILDNLRVAVQENRRRAYLNQTPPGGK